jgi:hypothetical protein
MTPPISATLTLKDTLDILIRLIGDLRWHWGFYATVVIALVGWVLTATAEASKKRSLVIAPLFLLFAWGHVGSLRELQAALEATRAQAAHLAQGADQTLAPELVAYVRALPSGRFIWTRRLHYVLDALVLAVILLGGVWRETAMSAADKVKRRLP